jgi:hypothetical protein
VAEANRGVKLPKRTLEKVHLGQSFAEYDDTLTKKDVFVHTPALSAAANFTNPHCFFVGRRGTGKTTITRYLEANYENVLLIRPEIFSPSSSLLSLEDFRDAKQRPFKSLTSAFRRSLQDEVLLSWNAKGRNDRRIPGSLVEEIEVVEDLDFDLRSLDFIDQLTRPLVEKNDPEWIRAIKKPKSIGKEMGEFGVGQPVGYSVLLDAIDESWDGSELAVVYLAALMHACLEINSQSRGMRALIFLRENIFERVRVIDTEFSRLETCVVGLDWTEEKLLEMVERRFNAPLVAKFSLGGQTWDHFVENGTESREMVFEFCQRRPRDILTYTGLALDTAQSHKHERILIEDLQDARRRFSDSRLKDLGDEYQENYPQLALVLSRFYGLGQRWTMAGVESLLRRLFDDPQIVSSCGSWLYSHASPEQFIRLMYDIGFFGLIAQRGRDGANKIIYRSLGPRSTTPPPVTHTTDISIHPTYWDALDLQDFLVTEFGESEKFRSIGLVTELPGSLDYDEYRDELKDLSAELKTMPTGFADAQRFEECIGRVVRLCFFRVLTNVEAQVRDIDGTVRRDWIASNRAENGFWDMVRQRYGANQVLFECKNYEDLKSSDFQQSSYYMGEQAGKFVVLFFRGEVKNHYFQHVKRINGQCGGIVIMLNDKDAQVFIRQSMNGRLKDGHLQDKFDKVVRMIS